MSTHNRYAFDGRVVLVTGGASGIGQAIARALLDNGARVAVVGRRTDRLHETLEGYDEQQVLAVTADISDPAEAAGVVTSVTGHFGRLDVFVNNAAMYASQQFTDLTAEDWDRFRRANIDAFVHLAQKALPELERTGGNLVAVGSVSGLRADWGQPAYNARRRR